MIFAYYIFSALLIYLSYKSFRGGVAYYSYFESELAKPASRYAPFVTIAAPCKGLEDGLEANLRALLEQDYPEYEVIFVVDSEDDPATDVINVVLNDRSKMIVAGKAATSSQKVENLRD